MATDYLTSGRNLRSLINDGLGQFNEDVSEAQMCGKPPLCVSLSFTNRVQISRELTSRAHAARVSDNVQVPRFTAEGAGSSLFQVFFFFFFLKRIEWYVSRTNQTATLGYVSRTNQVAALGYVPRTNHIPAFGYLAPITAFGYCFLVNDVMD